MADTKRPLWTCPQCGHLFVTPNMWHSCSNYALEHHFEGKDPVVREIFDRFLSVAESCGPVTVIPQKTRIVLQVRVRFGGGVARKKWFNAALWLTRKVRHRCLTRVDKFGPESYGLHFRLEHPDYVDQELAGYIREAYRVGRQEHVYGGEGDA